MVWLLRMIAPMVSKRVLSALGETLNVLAVVAAALLGLWWLRHDAARDAATVAAAECAHTISKIETTQREGAESRADDAQSAGEAVPPVPTGNRSELDRLCRSDENCRTRANAH